MILYTSVPTEIYFF